MLKSIAIEAHLRRRAVIYKLHAVAQRLPSANKIEPFGGCRRSQTHPPDPSIYFALIGANPVIWFR